MSTGAPTLNGVGRWLVSPRPRSRARTAAQERPVVRLVTFTALAGYGLVRWATLMRPAPGWRLLGLLALAVAMAGAVPLLSRLSRVVAAGTSVAILLLAFPVSGLRWHWLKHMSIARTTDRIEHGLTLLPNALVPYLGPSHDVRLVIVLGAAVLALDAAAVLAFAPGPLGDGRRAAAALPLIALAVVPSTLIRPEWPYMQGLILFALLAAFMWGERVRAGATASAVGIVALAGVGAAIAAPRIDRGSPLVDYRAWTGTTTAVHVDTFNWNQTYGPLRWPQNGHEVLTVEASKYGDYWKAEDLDTFDGYGWVGGVQQPQPQLPAPRRDALERWTQSLRVSIVGMKTPYVIAAGQSSEPASLGVVGQGNDEGTWVTSSPMGPGTTYELASYSPHPTAQELSTAGRDYPTRLMASYLTLGLPVPAGTTPNGVVATVPVTFPLFHSHRRPALPSGVLAQGSPSAVVRPGEVASVQIALSPYARAYALARRLATRARTPYAFVMSVRNYLSQAHGFSYTQNPPKRQYPLESFLFSDKEGYCQQFSGAMAMLLRMGGIPARVAAGFTQGNYDKDTRRWVVSDIDAHAWIEAWFPTYGWVRFDATPGTAPARGGLAIAPVLKPGGGAAAAARANPRRETGALSTAVTTTHPHSSNGAANLWWLIPAIVGLVLVLAVALRHVAGGDGPRTDLLSELERALARTGRPLHDGITLVALERRLHSAPDAEAYIRTLRLARYGAGGDTPSAAQRRALRRELGRGLGFIGRLRALWALPPRL
jgi:transglutaminase-like putative cysteine protease